MNETVETILHTCNSIERVELVKKINTATELYSLMKLYNWNDGFEIPLVVVTHPKCDLGLALMLFWEIDEPKLY